jgi:hypothetical protein
MNMFKYKSALLASLAACLLATNVVWASDEPSGGDAATFDLNAMTCKEVMILSGGDRDSVVSFLLGYFAGHAKSTELNLTALSKSTDKFLDTCLDNPTANALTTMQGALSQ